MGKKLTNAPVYYTVAQVQFNHMLGLDSYVPAIQSRMREEGFPDFKKAVIQNIDFPVMGSQQGQMISPAFTMQSRYMFGDIEGSSLFILETNALSFQTTCYDTFETFSEALLKGLSILHESFRLDFVERIGLRYLDAVQPSKAGETLRDFLVPEVLSLALRDEVELQHSVSETLATTAAGQLMSRVLIRHGRVGLPVELEPMAPAINPRFTASEGLHAIVDTDAFVVQRETFDLDKIRGRLTALHNEIVKSFYGTVTGHARATWS